MEKISFSSRNPVTLRDMADPKVRETPFEVGGYLSLPEGNDRVPGIVVAEGLGGLKKSREFTYGRKLARAGYATLIPDSFAARGKKDAIHTWRALAVTEAQMLADAFAALHTLAAHPRVDPNRIGIVGFSYGGMTSVLSAYVQLQQLFSSAMGEQALPFAAHASYYGCSVPRLDDPRTTGKPAMILLGEKDRNVSVERWKHIARDLERGGSPVNFTVFPGTYHQWDSDDEQKRFVLFALADVRMRVKPDHRLIDEKTGLEVTGRLKRALAIGLSVSARGYHIQRDEEVCAESDRMLLDFFSQGLDAPDLAPPQATAAQ